MQEVFENIIEKLKEVGELKISIHGGRCNGKTLLLGYSKGIKNAIEIVKQETEKFGTDTNVGSNGWISVSERLPETDKYILLSFSNFSIPCVGRYNEDENGGAFYIGDEDETCVSQDLFVNAWMPLPEPYSTEGEKNE